MASQLQEISDAMAREDASDREELRRFNDGLMGFEELCTFIGVSPWRFVPVLEKAETYPVIRQRIADFLATRGTFQSDTADILAVAFFTEKQMQRIAA